MASDLLRQLADRYAFDGTPRFFDLGVYHVPFESMIGRPNVETKLGECTERGERVALIAESGGGKSSLVSHVLGPTAELVAPIVVPVHALGSDAASAGGVADAILGHLGRQVRTADGAKEPGVAPVGDRREVVHRKSSVRGADVGWRWLRGSAAKQVEVQIGSSELIGLDEKIESVFQVLQAIHAESLMPVFVFDDTDRWIGPSQSETVIGFFGEAIRWLTEMPASVVVATHSRYLESNDSPALLEYLDTRIEIPRVPSSTQLHRILERRVESNLDEEPGSWNLWEVVSRSAVDDLFGAYEEGASLRRVLQLAHIALKEAVDASDETVEGHHIQAALQA